MPITKPTNRFLIFALARTGSTSLHGLLNLHPAIRCAYEPFNPDVDVTAAAIGGLPELRLRVAEIWRDFNGIKHVWHPGGWPFARNSPCNRDLLTATAEKVILLWRRNILRRVVSGQLSHQARKWALNDAQDRVTYEHYPFAPLDLEAIRWHLESEEAAIEECRRELRCSEVAWIEVTYEEMFTPTAERYKAFENICDFLGYAPDEIPWTQADQLLDRPEAKMNSRSVYESIPNYAEIEARHGNDKTGWLLREVTDPARRESH